VLLVEPAVFHDARGTFLEMLHVPRYAAAGMPDQFLQHNHSRSKRGVLRGLHYQLDRPQGKLISVVRGEIYDVAVDIRVGSPTFGRSHGQILRDGAPSQLWIPAGFAHGFCVLSDVADVIYACTDVYEPGDDRGVLWNDPRLGIRWPVVDPILSDKDRALAPLDESRADLPRHGA
jgi:dTDP-4-dehydrorhamnose 3,5-epimerase